MSSEYPYAHLLSEVLLDPCHSLDNLLGRTGGIDQPPQIRSVRAGEQANNDLQAFSELQGVAQYQELIDLELLKMGAFPAADMTPQLFASKVTMPNLTIQVRNDAWTKNPQDAQKTFDMLGTKDKEMIWVENTTHRFRDGYNYFGRYPEKVLAFFDRYMKQGVRQKEKEIVDSTAA